MSQAQGNWESPRRLLGLSEAWDDLGNGQRIGRPGALEALGFWSRATWDMYNGACIAARINERKGQEYVWSN